MSIIATIKKQVKFNALSKPCNSTYPQQYQDCGPPQEISSGSRDSH